MNDFAVGFAVNPMQYQLQNLQRRTWKSSYKCSTLSLSVIGLNLKALIQTQHMRRAHNTFWRAAILSLRKLWSCMRKQQLQKRLTTQQNVTRIHKYSSLELMFFPLLAALNVWCLFLQTSIHSFCFQSFRTSGFKQATTDGVVASTRASVEHSFAQTSVVSTDKFVSLLIVWKNNSFFFYRTRCKKSLLFWTISQKKQLNVLIFGTLQVALVRTWQWETDWSAEELIFSDTSRTVKFFQSFAPWLEYSRSTTSLIARVFLCCSFTYKQN